MEVLKIENINQFITENLFSPERKRNKTITHPTSFNPNVNLPKLLTGSLGVSPQEKNHFHSSRKEFRIGTLSLLKEYPLLTTSSLNNINCTYNNNSNNSNHKLIDIKRHSINLKTPDEGYYEKIFNCTKNIFKTKQGIMDNKLNIYGDENEAQYQKHIFKINVQRQKEGKTLRENNKITKEINDQVKDIKKKICFLKGVVDYAYPKTMLQKNKINSKPKGLKTDSNIAETHRVMASNFDIKPRKSTIFGRRCYTISSKDDKFRIEKKQLDMFLLQAINVQKC